jgi:PPIC-type PPIASE domain.
MAIIGRIRQKAWIAVALIAVAILAFIFMDGMDKFGNKTPNNIATIDGVEITRMEFEAKSATIEANMKRQYNLQSLNSEQSYIVRQQAYQELVSEKLLESEYDKIGIAISKEEMNDLFFGDFVSPMVLQNFSDPKTGQYNKQAVSQYIAQFDKLPADEQANWRNFEQYVKTSRLQEKYQALISKSMYMPKKIASHLSDLYDKTTSSRYTLLPFSSIPDNQVRVEEADYKKYYEDHKNEFKLPEAMRDVQFVKFNVVPSQADIAYINDTVKKTYAAFLTTPANEMAGFVSSVSDQKYDSNYYKKDNISQLIPDSILSGKSVGSFIAPFQNGGNWVMAKVTSIQARPDSIKFSRILILNSKAGGSIKRSAQAATKLKDSVFAIVKTSASFENDVAKYSDDPEAKKNMGESGWLMDGQLQADLYNLVNATAVGGVFVYTIPNDMGYMICKVTGKTSPITKYQLASIVMQIKASDKTVGEARDKANVFLSSATNLAAFTSTAQKQNLNILSSTLRDMDYKLNGTPYCRDIVRWVFNSDTKKGDVAPEVYEVQDETQDMFIVIALKDVKEKGILPYEQAKPYMENLVRIEKKATLLLDKASKLEKQYPNIDQIAVALNSKVDTAANISFGDGYFAAAGPEMNVLGMLSTAKAPGILKPVKGYNGVYVLQVDAISRKAIKEDANMIQQTFDQKTMQKTSQLRLPLQVLQEKAKIKNHFSFFF